MLALSKNIEKLKASPDSSILMSAMDIPVFHLISQKELTFFKLYTWSHSVYNYEGCMDDFMKEVDTPEIISCYQKIVGDYELIPSAEIWTESTVNTTLRLINYYLEIGSFSNKDFPLLICEQILYILSKLQNWAENSSKSNHTTSYQLYVSEIDFESTYVLLKHSGQKNCIIRLFTINSLNIFDKGFCMEAENYLAKLLKRSTLLCSNSEKERIKFFSSQRQKVKSLIGKIQNSF